MNHWPFALAFNFLPVVYFGKWTSFVQVHWLEVQVYVYVYVLIRSDVSSHGINSFSSINRMESPVSLYYSWKIIEKFWFLFEMNVYFDRITKNDFCLSESIYSILNFMNSLLRAMNTSIIWHVFTTEGSGAVSGPSHQIFSYSWLDHYFCETKGKFMWMYLLNYSASV